MLIRALLRNNIFS